jgi:DNA-binding XRE family transcriptional regulator
MSPVDVRVLGLAFRQRREKIGMTQETVAHDADISTRHYQDIEAGRKGASLVIAIRIAKAMNSNLNLIVNAAERLDAATGRVRRE